MTLYQEHDTDTPLICLTSLYADHGSIVQFEGHSEEDTNARCIVSVDHRFAQAIVDAITEEGDAIVDPEDWQIRWLS